MKVKSYWAFAITWNAQTCRTTALVDALSNVDMSDIKNFLKGASPLLVHPLTFPEIILHMVMVYITEKIRPEYEEVFFNEEHRTKLFHVFDSNRPQERPIWDWTFDDFKMATSRVNKFNTTIVYVARRYNFANLLAKRFLVIMDELKRYEYEDCKLKDMIEEADWARRERLNNKVALLDNYEHYMECMGKRAANLATVVRISVVF